MRLLRRSHTERNETDEAQDERPAPDEAPEPLPEHEEPRLADPGPTDLSKRDYFAIVRRAIKKFNADHMTNIAAALAYYAFLAIPSALLVAVGIFSLVASPSTITTVIGKLHGIVPGQATDLLDSSLRNMIHNKSTGITVLSVGGVLAFWSLTGAMQNLMWALNIAYDRDEGRGFVRRRITALWLVLFALIGFALAFGVLVLGPHLSTWIGDAIGTKTVVKIAWYIAEWPLLVAGLLVAFAGFMYYGPNVKHPRWRFLSFGSVIALVIWLVGSRALSVKVSKIS
jgi:membrane protein